MTAVAGAFPYDLDHLLGGRVRVLIADLSLASPPPIPDNLDDVHDLIGPYAPKDGWVDLGASRDGSSYSRSIATEGWEIQQVNTAVLEEITGVGRSFTTSIAEIKPEHLQLIEQSGSIDTIAAANEKSAQKGIPIGDITDLNRYRVAFVAQRKKQQGIVTEDTAGPTRSRFVGIVLNECTIAADETGIDFEKGNLSHIPLTFTAYPSAGAATGEEYGGWFSEDAGVIAVA